ncbi:hypothetical protein [Ruegeria lacuscaerulensis]|uniref:hypothetical protein n=1 Tax=Ruegeria lacuscaerulensis TaxID=55218 RepID=UPI00147F7D66|nr:hypothetical protein [Ruegeria lacuscaerulensis]
MKFRHSAIAAVFAILPLVAQAQSTDEAPMGLFLELNTIQDVEGACLLTFVTQNETETKIDDVGYETVIFDSSGSVVTLALYNFGELPKGLPRVRQFLVRNVICAQVGRVLINGIKTCVVGGSESKMCTEALTLRSRTDVELLG